MEQIIISIGREFGSGGHVIAEQIANKLNIALYDKNLIDQVAMEKGLDPEEVKAYEEKPKKLFFNRKVNGYSNSIEDNLAQMEFDFISEKAKAGQSFVIVGRCSDHVLKGYKSFVSIFVCADEDAKIKRLMEVRNLHEADAKKEIVKHDRDRKKYHDMYSKFPWGDSKAYDLCINSSKLGIDGTVEALLNFIECYKKGIN